MRKRVPSHIVWNKHNPNNKIGRGNYKDVIHHKDEDRNNNHISNLQKMTHAKHKGLHAKGNKWWAGKKHTEETKIKIGAKSKGRKHTKEFKKKMSLAMTGNKYSVGRKYSKEARERMSKSVKTSWIKRRGE